MSVEPILKISALFLLVGCNRTPPPAPPAVAPPNISTVKPEKKSIRRTIEQPGTVQAFEETTLYAKLPGFIRALSPDPAKAQRPAHDRLIDLGSRVKAGQVLAELAIPELEQEYQQKEALVRQMEAETEQSKKSLAAADAAVAAAKAHGVEARAGLARAKATHDRWQREVERTARLVGGGVIDAQTRDEIDHQLKVAEAGRAEAQARIASADAATAKAAADRDKAAADVTAAEAKRDVAKADARRVDSLRDYQKIKAPFDGVVTRRSVHTGDHVTADGKAGLFTIARTDPVRVVLRISEADAGLIAEGQNVAVTLPGGTAAGTVTRTSWSLDPGSRTLRTELDLPNPDAKLRPGMYATAKLTVELPAEWTLPAAAITRAGDDTIAFLDDNGKAVKVNVQLARGDTTSTQILRFRKVGQSDWTSITGNEVFLTPATQIVDGKEWLKP